MSVFLSSCTHLVILHARLVLEVPATLGIQLLSSLVVQAGIPDIGTHQTNRPIEATADMFHQFLAMGLDVLQQDAVERFTDTAVGLTIRVLSTDVNRLLHLARRQALAIGTGIQILDMLCHDDDPREGLNSPWLK